MWSPLYVLQPRRLFRQVAGAEHEPAAHQQHRAHAGLHVLEHEIVSLVFGDLAKSLLKLRHIDAIDVQTERFVTDGSIGIETDLSNIDFVLRNAKSLHQVCERTRACVNWCHSQAW